MPINTRYVNSKKTRALSSAVNERRIAVCQLCFKKICFTNTNGIHEKTCVCIAGTQH